MCIGKCSFKCQSIQDNYKDLTGALPIANLLSALFSKGVIVADQKEEIEKKSLQKDKVSYLFDQIILPALTAGHDLKYNNLIAVMLSNDDTTVQHLAKKLIQGMHAEHSYTYMYIHVLYRGTKKRSSSSSHEKLTFPFFIAMYLRNISFIA